VAPRRRSAVRHKVRTPGKKKQQCMNVSPKKEEQDTHTFEKKKARVLRLPEIGFGEKGGNWKKEAVTAPNRKKRDEKEALLTPIRGRKGDATGEETASKEEKQ